METAYLEQSRTESAAPVGAAPVSPSEHRAVVGAILLVALVVAVDLWLPLGVASAVPYTFAVLLALKARPRYFAVQIAVVCCTLTILKVVFFPERGTTELWKVYANRGLAVFTIVVTAFLGMQRRRSDAKRQQAEEATRLHLADLAHMGRLKTAGQLATGLAHELNQPLAAISLHAEVALHLGQTGGAELRSALEEIVEQSQRAGAIVRTMRGMVRKAEPNRAPVRLGDIVHEVVRLIEVQARRAGVVLDLQLADDLPEVFGDRIQLGQILFNLLQNAFEAAPGAIEVRSRYERGQCVLRVADTGAGFADPDVERVFERFYTTKPTGMGMGLAICRSIAFAHGGTLTAAPNHPRGAVFTLSLPSAPGETS